MKMFLKIKKWAKQLKQQVLVLYLAYKDPRVPLFPKVITSIVVAYAFSPIDLIPDFIPVLGYIDDIILIPLGIYFALKLLPKHVLDDCYNQAQTLINKKKPKNWIVGSLIIAIWLTIAVYLSIWIINVIKKRKLY